jgi:hypothetical protein
MSLGGLIASALLVAIALVEILRPFLKKRRAVEHMVLDKKQRTQDELVTTYERVLSTIHDLDDDYNTGKIEPNSYQEERKRWTEQGVKLLQQIGVKEDVVLPMSDDVVSESDVVDDVLEDEVERAIAEYRAAQM